MPQWKLADSERLQVTVAVALAASLFTTFIIIVAVSPMNGEDYGLSVPIAAPRAIDAIIQGAWKHALGWNARLGELLAIVELNLPRGIYVALQGAASLAFITEIACLSGGGSGSRRAGLGSQLLAGALLILAWPRLEIFFWETVAAGYLQPLVMLMALLLFVRSENTGRFGPRVQMAGALLLAFFVGFAFENVGPALALYFVVLAYYERGRGMPPRLALIAALGVAVGWIGLMSVPSTGFRVTFYRHMLGVPELSAGLVVANAISVTTSFVSACWPLLLISGAGLLLIVKSGWRDRDNFRLLLLLLPAVLSVGAVSVSPYIEPRAFVFAWAIMLSIAVRGGLIAMVKWRGVEWAPLALGVLAVPFLAYCLSAYLDFGFQSQVRARAVEAALGSPACRDGLAFPPLVSSAPASVLNNREDWVRSSLGQVSRYYGCKLVLPQNGTD